MLDLVLTDIEELVEADLPRGLRTGGGEWDLALWSCRPRSELLDLPRGGGYLPPPPDARYGDLDRDRARRGEGGETRPLLRDGGVGGGERSRREGGPGLME